MIGQTISHYRITAKLGAGGMGEVYLAEDTKLDRKVALKFLPESLSRDPEARSRLLREAKAASKLNHARIVTVYALEEHNDRDFIAMEYVEGRILKVLIQPGDLGLDRILDLALQIVAGLVAAHVVGVQRRSNNGQSHNCIGGSYCCVRPGPYRPGRLGVQEGGENL